MKGLMKDVQLDEVDEGIFSCLGKAERQSDYDSKDAPCP